VAYWIKITYDRNTYIIDLDQVTAFCCDSSGRLSFNLPDSNTTIIVSQSSNSEAYQLILDYVEKQTGYNFS
jgi:hypothetical protein